MATSGATTSTVDRIASPVAAPSVSARIRARSLCSSRTLYSPNDSPSSQSLSP